LNTNNTYYNQNAQAFSDSTFSVDMQPLYNEFLPLVTAGSHILDGGCGSARDAKSFKDQGFKVTAIDASEELVKIATQYLEQKVELKTFQQINDINLFDGIWCCASLLHVPFDELDSVFTKLSNALKTNGVLYVSFKYGEPTQLKEKSQREHNGRLFTDLNEQSLNNLLANQQNLQLNKTWITGDRRAGREGEQWLNAIIIKSELKNTNPVGEASALQSESQPPVDGASAAKVQNQKQLSNANRQNPVGEALALQSSRTTQEQLPAVLQNESQPPVGGASAAKVQNQEQLSNGNRQNPVGEALALQNK